MLSDAEKVALKVIGQKIAANKGGGKDILSNALVLDGTTGLEYIGTLAVLEAFLSTTFFLMCPTVEMAAAVLKDSKHARQYERELFEAMGWA